MQSLSTNSLTVLRVLWQNGAVYDEKTRCDPRQVNERPGAHYVRLVRHRNNWI
jgi:hypothetical protein